MSLCSSFLETSSELCREERPPFFHSGLLLRCHGGFFGIDFVPPFLLLHVSEPFGISVFRLMLVVFRLDKPRHLIIRVLSLLLPVIVAFLPVLFYLGIGFVHDFFLSNALFQREEFVAKLYQHLLLFWGALAIEGVHLLSKVFGEFICLLTDVFGEFVCPLISFLSLHSKCGDDLEESLITLIVSPISFGVLSPRPLLQFCLHAT
jgi:hypothetical protein